MIINILLILVLLFLPLGELLRFEIINHIVLKPLDIIVGITALFTVIYFALGNKLPKTYLSKPVGYFSVVALLSLIVNLRSLEDNQAYAALLYLVRYVSYALIYYFIQILNKNLYKKAKILLLAAGCIFLILGYIQYFLYANLRNLYYLGWDEHNYRLFSSFLDPNFAGAFLVLFLLFTLAEVKKSIVNHKKTQSIAAGLLSILTTVAIFLTYSRSALLMLIVSVTVYLIILGRKKLVLIPILTTIFILIIISPTFNRENTNIFRKTSSFARFETYDNALKIIYDHPVLGVGFNAYRYAQQDYGFRPVNSEFPDHATAGTDNSFLFITATTGFVGLLAYLFVWYSILARAFLLKKNKKHFFPPIVIASVIGLFINSFFINSLFYPSIMLWMWTLIGFMDRE